MPAGAAQSPAPKLVRDVKTGSDTLGSLTPAAPDPIQDYVQPDTEIEPSIAVNPANPKNVVSVYQEGRIADGGGLNDKNLIVVDTSDAPGHHKGRVYVVWDRVAPVLVDYCDHDCDRLSNWLPDFQTIPDVVFPGQGIGAYPVVLKNGGLGIVMDTLTGGLPVPSGPDELDAQ